MKLTLVSKDPEVQQFCREVMLECIEKNWEFAAVSPNISPLQSDLYIWDFHPESPMPKVAGSTHRHFFLVTSHHLSSFSKTALPQANILVKPLTRPALRAFLSNAMTRASVSNADAASLRADRDQMLQCLIQANLKLQIYDHERTTFLARTVHDLRAPLTALNGYCGLLLDQNMGPLTVDQREVLHRMEHCSKRLSRMVSAMFQLSIGRRLTRAPRLKENDILECINQAIHELWPFANEKHLSISKNLEPPTEPLYFERSSLEQVVLNLLDNAYKFTPKVGNIEIRGYPFFWDRRSSLRTAGMHTDERRAKAEQVSNSYRVEIKDSGSGIPPDQLDSVFEEFTTTGAAGDRSGGGLGLAICRMIMEQHQGRVWADNNEPGPGTTCSFILPYRRSERVTYAVGTT